MENTRTIAFQVPEELFQKIKDYLKRNNMTQKEFMLGLIENEIERDLAQRAAEAPENTEDYDEQEEAAVSDDSAEDLEEAEEEYEEQDNGDVEGVSDDESEDLNEDADEELDEDESVSEEAGIAMAM